jgi:hypothetical protein
MISDLRKSINSILFERVTSPLYGTVFFSWGVWNWKIIYLTLFVREENIAGTKIDFILNNYNDINGLVLYPLISAFLLLTVIPFISNGAYWLQLRFSQWKVDQKNIIERKQLLTLEQSLAIRKELKDKETEFEQLLVKKDQRIGSLELLVHDLESKLNDSSLNNQGKGFNKPKNTKISVYDYGDLVKNEKAFKYFDEIVRSIKGFQGFPIDLPDEVKEYYIINDLVDETEFGGRSIVDLTSKGNDIYKDHFNSNFSKQD